MKENNTNPATWQEALTLCLKKRRYVEQRDAFARKNAAGRLIAALTGRFPTDPCPMKRASELANLYIKLFNKELGCGKRHELRGGCTAFVGLDCTNKSYKPVLNITYYDGACYYQTNMQLLPDGSFRNLEMNWPACECGVNYLPATIPPDLAPYVSKHNECLTRLTLYARMCEPNLL